MVVKKITSKKKSAPGAVIAGAQKLHAQLEERAVSGTPYGLLYPKASVKPGMLDMEARQQIARRILEVGPKLPRYVDRSLAEEMEEQARARLELASKDKREKLGKFLSTREPREPKLKLLEGGVALKKICADFGIDPRIARRLLRSKGKKPSGRWEWLPDDAKAISEFLKTAHAAEAGKATTPVVSRAIKQAPPKKMSVTESQAAAKRNSRAIQCTKPAKKTTTKVRRKK